MYKQDKLLTYFPEEITFHEVKEGHSYTEYLKITNVSKYSQIIEITASNPEVLKISEDTFNISGGQSKIIEIKFKTHQMKQDHMNFNVVLKVDKTKYQLPVQAFKRSEIMNSPEVDQTFREENSIDKKFQEVQQENFILVQKIEELEDQVVKLKKLLNSDQKNSNYILDELAEKNKVIEQLEEKLENEIREKNSFIQEFEKAQLSEDYFKKIKDLLHSSSPDLDSIVDIALKQERLQNEKKNQKVLEMFQLKDAAISELEKKLEEVEKDYFKVTEMIEEQRNLFQKNDERIRVEQKEKNEYKDKFLAQETQIAALRKELERYSNISDNYLDEIKGRSDESNRLKMTVEKLSEESKYLNNEALKNQALYIETLQELDATRAQLHEYMEREQMIKELYARHQENKDDLQRIIQEKERTINILQSKLVESESSRVNEERSRSVVEDDKNNQIRDLVRQVEDLKRMMNDLKNESMNNSAPLRTEELKESYKGEKLYAEKRISELEKQIDEMTQSFRELQIKLNEERREKNELIISHNQKITEVVNKFEDLKHLRESERQMKQEKNEPNAEEIIQKERENYLNLVKKYQNLEKELQESQNEKKNYAEEVEILTQRLEFSHTRESQDEASDNLISKLNARVSALKYKEQKLYEENARLEGLYNELKSEYESAKMAWGAERMEFMKMLDAKSRGENINFEGSMSNKNLEILLSSNSSENLGRENQILKSIKANLENEVLLAVNKEKLLQSNIETMTQERNEFREKYSSYKKQLNDLEETHRDSERKHKEEIFSMRKQIMDLQNDLKSFEEENTEVKSKLQQKVEYENRANFLEHKKSQLEREISEIKSEYSSKIEEMGDQLQTLKKLNYEFKQKINELENEIENQNDVITKKDNIQTELNQQIKLLKETIAQTKQDLYSAETKSEDLMREIERLKLDIGHANEINLRETSNYTFREKEMQDQLSYFENQVKNLRNEKDQMRQDFHLEIEKITRTHQETIDVIRQENAELERKFFEEVSQKRRENEFSRQKEAQLVETIQELKDELNSIRDRSKNYGAGRRLGSERKANSSFRNYASPSKVYNSDTEEFESSLKKSRDSEYSKKLDVSDVNAKNMQIIRLKNKVEALESQASLYEKRINDLEKERAIITVENQKMAHQYETAKSKFVFPIYRQEKIEETEQTKRSLKRVDTIYEDLEELNYYIGQFKDEKERYTSESIHSTTRYDQRTIEKLVNLIQSLQESYIAKELEGKKKMETFEKESYEFQLKYQDALNDLNSQKITLEGLERDINRKEKEAQDLFDQLNSQKEKSSALQDRIQELESKIVVKPESNKIKVEEKLESNEEIERLKVTVTTLRDEMVQQNERFEEALDIYQKQTNMLKEKFLNDVKDLETRINVYFNQNETCKRSLSPKREKKQLEKMFEGYWTNLSQSTHKEASASLLKDKIKNLIQENAKLKVDLKRVSENVQKLTEEKNSLPKKRTTTTMKSTKNLAEVENKENIIEKKEENVDPTIEAHLMTLRVENKKLIQEKNQLQDLNLELQQEIEKLSKSEEVLQSEIKKANKENVEQQKNFKTEINKMLKEVENVKQKWYSPESYEKIVNDLQESENALKQAKEELARKKEFIQNLRNVKDNKHTETDELKKEIEQLKEEIEKLKRANKEYQRKEQTHKEFKEKYDALKAIEKSLTEEKNQNIEKIKSLKADITRKENALKDLRDKVDLINLQGETKKLQDDEAEKGRETIKRLKGELERKDANLKTLKLKLDTVIAELDHVKGECLNRTQDVSYEIDKELKKHEQTRVSLKNIESQYQNLVFLLRRLYRDTSLVIQKLKNKNKPLKKVDPRMGADIYKFSESLDILNLTPEEIQMFVDPKANQNVDTSFTVNKNVERFEEELSKPNGINPSTLYDMLSSIIEERVVAEKNC